MPKFQRPTYAAAALRQSVGEIPPSAEQITPDTIRERFAFFWRLTRPQLKALIADESTEVGDLAIINVLTSAAMHGDANKLNAVLDRMVGKVVQKQEITVEKEALRSIPTEKLVKLIGELTTIDAHGVTIDEPA